MLHRDCAAPRCHTAPVELVLASHCSRRCRPHPDNGELKQRQLDGAVRHTLAQVLLVQHHGIVARVVARQDRERLGVASHVEDHHLWRLVLGSGGAEHQVALIGELATPPKATDRR